MIIGEMLIVARIGCLRAALTCKAYRQTISTTRDRHEEMQDKSRSRLSIAMVCDFFYPKIGGVESHIYTLAQALISRGHKIVVVTHAHPPHRYSIRYLSRGLKVYYLPVRCIPPASLHATLPNFFTSFPLLRQIFIREAVDLIHSHAALSAIGLEAIMHARTMQINAVFTEHSIMGLGGFGEMWGNKMLQGCLADIDAVICVSHTTKENVAVRAQIPVETIYAIPSAVVASDFQPLPTLAKRDNVTIVCMSRLVYRKGIDLLIGAIPRICQRFPTVRFVVGGDGPKMIELEQMMEKYQVLLNGRVDLLGSVRHEDVKNHLRNADIFLNTALTEAFGIGILEAACCGLHVVSTRVGGVPEVLPPDLTELAEPVLEDVIRAIDKAVHRIQSGVHNPLTTHIRVKDMYTWENVAYRTEKVYHEAMSKEQPDLVERFSNATGPIFGKVMCIVIVVDIILLWLLETFWPAKNIDVAPPFRQEVYDQVCTEYSGKKQTSL